MAGKVWLVGAGPGDISLITVKGMECIKHADVLVYDRLVNPELLTFAPEHCEQINVGKESDHHPIPQQEINQILADHAKAGKKVVRLKSGDPYVFGRGGEEAQLLVEQRVPFEVVPGVTSAIGGLTYAGIPVTHRDYASSFHVVTGHLRADKEKDPINWQALAQLQGTIVILMGVSNLANITEELMQYGKSADTPVGIIMWASRANQRIVTGTLSTIVQVAKEQKVKPPALIVIGEVVGLHNLLDFSQFISDPAE
ncbi:uroporphyrinogen-III C-methyltransferase [Entomomonas asaccharolytica]|uniref:uroporphyrinogen-III C-methyltransferase n=1 Tax=Entomomonas asaccharolytica TaxID=2785331 RepID=A0A974NH02_9GAMM|nr:uroporphyrinogen-III C-methyltransferase [Entomomonas asaccharolytica]QQP86461.1 uroporphyrinogen-III C-methyltransferase [Entomomonas asaccharolytica]